MKKFSVLAIWGCFLAGGCGMSAVSRWVNQPFQAIDLPLISLSPQRLAKVGFTTENLELTENLLNYNINNYFAPYLLWQFTENLLLPKIIEGKEQINHHQLINLINATTAEVEEIGDISKFEQIMQNAQRENLSDRPMSEIIQKVAQEFLGTKYKANLLDGSSREKLVVSFEELDCVLFVETVLAIARGIALQDHSYQTFINHLQNQRYRNGELPEYCRRLHYFSDWILDNQNRGNVQNISLDLGGISQNKMLNFMSKNRQRYPLMVNNDANYQCIVDRQSELAEVAINYIPKHRINRVYSQLQPGDIIAVVTNISGLDFTHTGLVYRRTNGRVGFIHASPAGTVTTARDLQRYVRNVKNSMGVVVVRAIDPRHLQP
ncbi:N-acetylmuramoyl-L-alanine amidase-like domain-containing protein [Aerosakkonemataceae cyanobacterium BLCC-F154]|uniref:N-acetylmuramoyl-L-alanine amidase-like domain-containing protein n=1 Tax=Floridaenema fluviatile BLCC-F154 TaxID=3153640 RepID=A0ABV4YA47_9CYAN